RDPERRGGRAAQAQARRGRRPAADHVRPDRRTSEPVALSTDPRQTTPPINAGGVNWRRNLAALWFAEFMAIFGFSFAFPFLSIFLNKDLGVHTGTDLYLWTAASASASGIAMAVASPIWGILGDRYGRKPMLIRSMLGGAITVGIIYFAQNPAELVVLRLLQRATSGTVT